MKTLRPDALRIAARNVSRHLRRTLLILSSIVFGVAAIVLSGGFIEDTVVETGEAMIHSYTGHLQVARKGYWEYAARDPDKYLIDDAESLRRDLAATPGVKEVLLRLSFSGLLNNGKTDWPVVAEGGDPEGEARLGTYVTMSEGRRMNGSDRFTMEIGKGVADALKIKPGDTVSMMVSAAGGATNVLEFRIVGIFQSFSKDQDARAVRVSLADARELLATRGVHSAVAVLADTSLTARVASAMRAALPGEMYDVKTWIELNPFYTQTVELYDQQFGFLIAVMIVMLVLGVSNAINMSVFERTAEFGTMMALGNSRRSVGKLIMTESALLGVLGSALGVLTGALLALLISHIGIDMPPPPSADLGYVARIRVTPEVLAIAFIAGVLATCVAGWFPSRVIRRMEIAQALRMGI